MTDRKVTLMSIGPVHPGWGEPSYIAAYVCLDYLAGKPVVTVPVTRAEAIRLIESLAVALRVTA